MKPYEERFAEAQSIYAAGLEKVRAKPMPKGQKYAPGTRVRITGNDRYSGLTATVEYTYAHAYWGDDVKSYSLLVDERGSSAWHDEKNLAALAEQLNDDASHRSGPVAT